MFTRHVLDAIGPTVTPADIARVEKSHHGEIHAARLKEDVDHARDAKGKGLDPRLSKLARPRTYAECVGNPKTIDEYIRVETRYKPPPEYYDHLANSDIAYTIADLAICFLAATHENEEANHLIHVYRECMSVYVDHVAKLAWDGGAQPEAQGSR